MKKTEKPFFDFTAADLMSEELVTLTEQTSLREAAHLFQAHHVSGAPVVDNEGQVIGVVSSTDFVRALEHEEARIVVSFDPFYRIQEPGKFPNEPVGSIATRDIVTVAPDQTVAELAQKMLDAHIHRVIVVDEQSRPVGIVTSTDVLGAVALAPAQLAGS